MAFEIGNLNALAAIDEAYCDLEERCMKLGIEPCSFEEWCDFEHWKNDPLKVSEASNNPRVTAINVDNDEEEEEEEEINKKVSFQTPQKSSA